MPDEKHDKFHLVPEGEIPCVWMIAGVVSYKLCDRNRDCENCPFDRVMRGAYDESTRGSVELIKGLVVPERIFFHQGHTWARVESPETVSVGLDDFAQKLVGKIEGIEPPKLNSTLAQGKRAWSIYAGEYIDMLSPIDGKVIELNERLFESAGLLNEDPYGEGWIARVRSSSIASNLKNLLSGDLARRWLEKEVESLFALANRALGVVLSDGGVPVGDGIAKRIDRDRWSEIAREFFLTKD